MPDGKTKIRFLEAREVRDHDKKVIQSFEAGEVVELTDASARRWLNRGVAEIAGSRKVEPEIVKPEGDALTAAIVAAIDDLDPDEDFTGDGAPSAQALQRELGYPISAAERDAAWEIAGGEPGK